MKRGLMGLVMCGWGIMGYSQARYDSMPNQPAHYRNQVEKFQKEQISSAGVIFLGNSIVESGAWKRLLKDSSVVNRGISGDNTFGVLQRLQEITRHKPAKLFLLIGINDLSKDIPIAVILQNIFSIAAQVHGQSPKTQLYIHSLLPVNPAVKDFDPRFSKNESIEEINRQLNKYGDALNYTFLNIHSHFLDDRLLIENRFTVDGLHLNEAGYVHWIEYLKEHKCL